MRKSTKRTSITVYDGFMTTSTWVHEFRLNILCACSRGHARNKFNCCRLLIFCYCFFSWGIQRRRYINVNFWRQNLAHSTCNKHKIMKNIEFLLSYGYICLLFITNVFKNKNRKFVSPLVVFCRLLSFVFCQREIDSDWSKI